METILSPRRLNQTADNNSESESETEAGSTVQASLAPSGQSDQSEEQKIIICPTARYLEVNRNKISSFDLLVHPPKRARFQTPSVPSSSSFPSGVTLQSVHYENEKIDRFCSIASSRTSSNKGHSDVEQEKSKTISKLCQSANCKFPPDNTKLLDWKKISLLYKQKGGDTSGSQSEEPSVHNHPLERIEEDDSLSKPGDDADNEKWAEFPSSKNYIYYVNYTDNFSTNFPSKPFFKTVNEKDENRNYLMNKSKSKDVNQNIAFPYLVSSKTASRAPLRTFKKPVYKLKGVINCEMVESPLPVPEKNTVHVNQLLIDALVTAPPFKRRKLNAPGEVFDQGEKLSMQEARFIFQVCNDRTLESEMIKKEKTHPPPPPRATIPRHQKVNNAQHAAPTVPPRTAHPSPASVSAPQSEYGSEQESSEQSKETFHNFTEFIKPPPTAHPPVVEIFDEDESDDEDDFNQFTPITMFRNVFHHPRIYSEPTGIGTPMNNSSPSYNEGRCSAPIFLNNNNINIPIVESGESSIPSSFQSIPSHGSPFTIILQKPQFAHSSISNPAFLVTTTGVPLNAVGESNLTIEDVTGEFEDGDCEEGTKNIETILAAGAPDLSLKESTSCSLVDFRLSGSDYEDEAGIEQPYDLHDSKGDIQQEVLLQPNPQLTFSSSVHSLSQNDRKDVTLDRFLERRRKSDYFVGKLAGLTKSVMKLYQKKPIKVKKSATNCDKAHEEQMPEELKKPSVSNNNFEISQTKSRASIWSGVSSPFDIDGVHITPAKIKSSTSRIKAALEVCRKKISKHNRISNPTLVPPENDTATGKSVPATVIPSKNPALSTSDSSAHDDSPHCCGILLQRPTPPSPIQTKVTKENIPPKTAEVPLKVDQIVGSPPTSMFKRFMKLFSKSKKVRIKEVKSVSSDSTDLPESPENSYDSLVKRLDKRIEFVTGKGAPAVPCYHCSKIIAKHTDSKEFYREKRLKLFKEMREFQEDSLKVYLETTARNLQNISLIGSMAGSKISTKLAPGNVDRLISEHFGRDKCSDRNTPVMPSSTLVLSPRKAISTSVLSVGETRLRSFLLPSLPIPPVMDMIVGESVVASYKDLDTCSSTQARGDADVCDLASCSDSLNGNTEIKGKEDLLQKKSFPIKSCETPMNNIIRAANDNANYLVNLSHCSSPTKGILKKCNKS